MSADGKRRCQHESCACPIADDHDFCSPYCANSEVGESLPGNGDPEGNCSCGHADCKTVPAQDGPEVVISTGRS